MFEHINTYVRVTKHNVETTGEEKIQAWKNSKAAPVDKKGRMK